MAETYGETPVEVLDSAPSDFWMNAAIRQATNAFKQSLREQQDAASTSAGAATAAQKNELVEDNESRADRREDLDGDQLPLQEQLEQLEDAEGAR